MQRVLLLISLLLTVVGYSKCPPWLQKQTAPLCPSEFERGILDVSFPVQAHILSSATWPYPSSYSDESPDELANFVLSLLVDKKDKAPFVYLVTSPDRYELFMKRFNDFFKSKEGLQYASYKTIWAAMLRPVYSDAPLSWNQDFIEFSTDFKTGTSSMHFLADYKNKNAKSEKQFLALQKAMSEDMQECAPLAGKEIKKIKTENLSEDASNADRSAYMGGNIEPLFKGACLVGDKLPEETKDVLCPKQKPFEVETSWLNVGHVDEFLSVIPSPQPKAGACPFMIQHASLEKAHELLRRNPKDLFLGNMGALGDLTTFESKDSVVDWVCELVQEARMTSTKNSHKTINSHAGKNSEVVLADTECNPFTLTNQDVLTSLLNFPDQLKLLKALNLRMRQSIALLKNKIQAQFQCKVEVIELPVLFLLNEDKHLSAMPYFSNPINGVVQEESVFYPAQLNLSFDKHIKEAYSQRGIKSFPVNTWKMLQQHGGLHCSSQTLRFCKPRN